MKKARDLIAKKAAKNAAVIMLLYLQDATGRKRYAYYAVRLDLWEDFKQAKSAGGDLQLEKYGIIIEDGVDEPSEEVKARMTRDYGFDHSGKVAV